MTKKKTNKNTRKAPAPKAGADYYKRPRGRAPKGKKWDHSQGKWVLDYDQYKKMVRRANDRLRELEKTGTAESSSVYQKVLNEATGKPWTTGRPFKVEGEGTDVKLRLRGKRDFEKMSEQEQEYYLKRLESILKAKSTTKTGQREIAKKISMANKGQLDQTKAAYERFMQNKMVSERYPNMSFETYCRLFEEFEKLKKNKADHYGSDDINMLYEYVDVEKVLTNPDGAGMDDLITAMHLIHVGDMEQIIDRGWAAPDYY